MRWFRAIVALLFVVGLVGGVTFVRNSYADPSEALWPEATAVTTAYSIINDRTEFVRKVVFPSTSVVQVDEKLRPILDRNGGWKRVSMRGGDVSYSATPPGYLKTIEVRRYQGQGERTTILIEYGALQPWQTGWLTLRHVGTNPAGQVGGYTEVFTPKTRRISTDQ